MRHDLKTLAGPFQAIWDGFKHYEVRWNDRNYQVGDYLFLHEWSNDKAQGRVIVAVVTYMSDGVFGLPKDLCVMSIDIKERRDSLSGVVDVVRGALDGFSEEETSSILARVRDNLTRRTP